MKDHVRSLIDLPVIRQELSLRQPNDPSGGPYDPIPPTQKRTDEVMQVCRDALHAKD